MAQSGFTPLSLYYSATASAVPTAGNLVAGELALNTNDGKLYYKNSSGIVTLLAGATSGPAGGSTTQVQYNNAGVLAGITGATTNGTAMTLVAPVLGTPASGVVTNLTGTASININGTVGATTATTGAFTTLSATGITTVAAGTALLPAIVSTTGTADTGLWFPAADTIAASTAGIEAMRIESTGNVGIGLTPNASLKLQVAAATNITLGIANATTITGAVTLEAVNNARSNNIPMELRATKFDFTGPTTGVSIATTGNVGIGNSSPVGKLDVTQATTNTSALVLSHSGAGGGANVNYGAQINVTGASNTNTGVYANAYGATNNYGVRIVNPPASATNWALYSDATAQSYFAGNVGIGISAPSKKLEIYASAVSLQIESVVRNDMSGAGVAAIGFNVSSSLAVETTSTKAGIGLVRSAAFGGGSLCFYNNNSGAAGDFTTADEKMRIDSAGNVGIGTASPATKFHVATVANTGVLVSSTDGTTFKGIAFNTGDNQFTIGTQTNHPVVFFTNNTERARIDNSGNVLVTNVAGLGYGTGAGGTVTQATDKSTAVTLNKPCGTITMNGAALGGLTTVTFTLNNSILAAADTITLNLNSSVANFVNYTLQASAWAAGTVIIKLRNDTVGSLSDAVQFNFNIHKGATS
jgi:hypothetical protein